MDAVELAMNVLAAAVLVAILVFTVLVERDL